VEYSQVKIGVQIMGRRNVRDGSLYFRQDKGLWVAQHNGVYRYSKDKDKAKQKLRELLITAESSKPENITVGKLLDQWLEYHSPNLKSGSIKRYKEAIRIYIKPISCRRSQSSHANGLSSTATVIEVVSEGASPNVIYLVHRVLSGACKSAAKWQLVRSNVIRDVDAPNVHRKEVEVFTPAEVQALLRVAKDERLGAAIVLALSTGARGGEILSLHPQDYNESTGTLTIRRTLVNNGTEIGTPKSKKLTQNHPPSTYG
jgi:integrase